MKKPIYALVIFLLITISAGIYLDRINEKKTATDTSTDITQEVTETDPYVYKEIIPDTPGLYALAEDSPMLMPLSENYRQNPKTYRIVRTTTVTNDSAGVDKLGIWLPMIEDWDSQDVHDSENISPPVAFSLRAPDSGSGESFWYFEGEPDKNASLTITEEYTCTCYEIHFDIEPDSTGAYDVQDPCYILYTRPDLKLESDDPEIRGIATALSEGKTNPYYVARELYDFVLDHMEYQLIEGLGGAVYAYENKYGECGDYSALFVALCRAAGIPARPVVGRIASSIEGNWHVWAEFYLPGYGWIPVDPSVADLNDMHEEFFGHSYNNLLIFNKAFRITLNPEPLLIDPEYDILQGWIWEYMGVDGTIDIHVDYRIEPTG